MATFESTQLNRQTNPTLVIRHPLKTALTTSQVTVGKTFVQVFQSSFFPLSTGCIVFSCRQTVVFQRPKVPTDPINPLATVGAVTAPFVRSEEIMLILRTYTVILLLFSKFYCNGNVIYSNLFMYL